MKYKTSILCIALFIFLSNTVSAFDFRVDGLCYNKNSDSISVSVTYESYDSNNNYRGISGDISIPSSVSYNNKSYSVTTIDKKAFQFHKSLTGIEIPNSVKTIGDEAFCDCTGLTWVTIPNSVTSIGDYAFCECYYLENIEIPNSVTTIGEGTFSNCHGLSSVTIPNSVTSIGADAFFLTGLTSITIPNSVTSIGSGAFSYCDGLKTVLWNTNNCDDFDFRNEIFNESDIESISFGPSVERIPGGLFSFHQSLKKITINKSVTSIGDGVFWECHNIKTVDCKASTPPTGGLFQACDLSACTLNVPQGSVELYRSSEGWGLINNIVGVVFPDEGDVNGDRTVDLFDVNEVINAMLGVNASVYADVNDDGTVNIDDLNIIINTILNRTK